MNDRPSIPAIITTDTSSTHDYDQHHDHQDRDIDVLSLSPESATFPLTPTLGPTLTVPTFVVSHSRSSSGGSGNSGDYLSPTQSPYGKSSARSSLEVPGSPSSFGGHSPTLSNRSASPFNGSSSHTYAASSHDGSTAPPSPTLSNRSSVHFATSVALRDNKPDEHSGIGSLSLLETNFGSRHARKASWASTSQGSGEDGTEPTEPDHGGSGNLNTHTNTLTTPTHIASSSSSSRSRSNTSRQSKKGKGRAAPEGDDVEPAADLTLTHPDPSKDTTDPTPFDFKPTLLASLLDPKNLRALEALGGVEGLLRGLGTDGVRGLCGAALTIRRAVSAGSVSAKGKGQRHDRESGLVGKLGKDSEDSEEGDGEGEGRDAYKAMLEVRHRVYGKNILPVRKSKTLLQLMWLALKDTVLVRPISFSSSILP